MRQSHKFLEAIDISSYRRYLQQMFITVGLLLFSLVSVSVHANPFATPDNFDAASCPTGHKKYTIANTASTAPSLNSWIAGERSRTFIFNESSGNKTFTINFPILIDTNNSNGTVPFYGSINDATSDAINLVHNSTRVQTDHTLDVSINRPVSKIGYKIQDLDSTTVRVNVGSWLFPRYEDRAPYIEQVDVSSNNGRLTFNDIFHNINEGRNIVKAKEGQNCSTDQCTIDATWGYQIANKTLNLAHSNEKRETSGSHATGYSDFYFCLAPPKVLVKKVLAGNRINDTDTNRDQFELSINRGTTAVNTVTTTGSGSAVTNNNNRNAISIAENTSYTITEKVRNGANGTTLGDIANYDATYTCNNATTGSTTVMPTTAMTYNATTKTRAFTLANTNYGDEITCTITNTPKSYTFSGIVFNDNGGIASPDSQLVGGIYNNPNFFNGIRNDNEAGIDGMNTVEARLSDCSNNPSANPIIATVNVTSSGTYSFSVLPKDLAGKTDLCIEEIEPTNWLYSVDTTPNMRKFSFDPNVLTYQTGVKVNGNTLNLDFGNVIKENTALVLVKSQYVHDCSLTDLTTINLGYNGLPTVAFSTQPIADIEPGQCIAYRIEAINRGNVPITDIVIKDTLQKSGDRNAVVTSTLVNPAPIGEISNSGAPTFPTNSLAIGSTGMVITNPFNLGISTPNNRKAIRFNTKYGSVVYQ
ncbi:hypothetical protein [Psychrobacter pulmonis]